MTAKVIISGSGKADRKALIDAMIKNNMAIKINEPFKHQYKPNKDYFKRIGSCKCEN